MVSICVQRLQGRLAQEDDSHQEACAFYAAAIAEGSDALGREEAAGMQWLLQDLATNAKLDQADVLSHLVTSLH